jgi:hypothetical protein
MHGMIAAGAAVVTLGAGGTAAALALSPVDSAGMIHGCYAPVGNKGSYTLTLQNAGTSCPRGMTAITWNQKGPQGPAGPAGATGATGATGPAGPAGAGLTFTTASGVNGPTVATAGTYFIDVTVAPENLTASAVNFSCAVSEPSNPPGGAPTALFAQVYELPEESSGDFTLSGIAAVPAGQALTVQCFNDATFQSVTVEDATWYVAPVKTS